MHFQEPSHSPPHLLLVPTPAELWLCKRYPWQLRQCLCPLPKLPVPTSTLCVLPFCTWAHSGIPCSLMLDSAPLAWLFPILVPWGGGPWRHTNSLGLFALQSSLTKDLAKQIIEEAETCSVSRVEVLLCLLHPYFSSWNSTISWLLQPRLPSAFPLLTSSSC